MTCVPAPHMPMPMPPLAGESMALKAIRATHARKVLGDEEEEG